MMICCCVLKAECSKALAILQDTQQSAHLTHIHNIVYITYVQLYKPFLQSGCCLPGEQMSQPVTSLHSLDEGQYWQAVKYKRKLGLCSTSATTNVLIYMCCANKCVFKRACVRVLVCVLGCPYARMHMCTYARMHAYLYTEPCTLGTK